MRRPVVDPEVVAIAPGDGDHVRPAADEGSRQSRPRQRSRIGHAQRRLAIGERGIERLARDDRTRRLADCHLASDTRHALGDVDVGHRAAAQRERQEGRPSLVFEDGVEESRPAAEAVDERLRVGSAIDRRDGADGSEQVAEGGRAALDPAEGVVSGEDAGEGVERRGSGGLAEHLRARGGVALAGLVHALAHERLEITTFGHDAVLSVTPMAACPPARVHWSEWTTKPRIRRGRPPFAPRRVTQVRWAGGSWATDRFAGEKITQTVGRAQPHPQRMRPPGVRPLGTRAGICLSNPSSLRAFRNSMMSDPPRRTLSWLSRGSSWSRRTLGLRTRRRPLL